MSANTATEASDLPPEPPRAPEPGECCQSGCEPCVYDLYWSAVERYEAALEAWKKRRSGV
jgi:hypothetical protein